MAFQNDDIEDAKIAARRLILHFTLASPSMHESLMPHSGYEGIWLLLCGKSPPARQLQQFLILHILK